MSYLIFDVKTVIILPHLNRISAFYIIFFLIKIKVGLTGHAIGVLQFLGHVSYSGDHIAIGLWPSSFVKNFSVLTSS